MKAPDLLSLLQDFHRDKLTALLRHQAGARLIGQYDANNTYQYVINREELQVTWIENALRDVGGTLATVGPQERHASGKGADAARAIMQEDVNDARAFIDHWQPRIETMTNARHGRMLGLVLGETLEQQRFFEQARAGRTDLLGRRGAKLEPARGEVLSTRWVE